MNEVQWPAEQILQEIRALKPLVDKLPRIEQHLQTLNSRTQKSEDRVTKVEEHCMAMSTIGKWNRKMMWGAIVFMGSAAGILPPVVEKFWK